MFTLLQTLENIALAIEHTLGVLPPIGAMTLAKHLRERATMPK